MDRRSEEVDLFHDRIVQREKKKETEEKTEEGKDDWNFYNHKEFKQGTRGKEVICEKGSLE